MIVVVPAEIIVICPVDSSIVATAVLLDEYLNGAGLVDDGGVIGDTIDVDTIELIENAL